MLIDGTYRSKIITLLVVLILSSVVFVGAAYAYTSNLKVSNDFLADFDGGYVNLYTDKYDHSSVMKEHILTEVKSDGTFCKAWIRYVDFVNIGYSPLEVRLYDLPTNSIGTTIELTITEYTYVKGGTVGDTEKAVSNTITYQARVFTPVEGDTPSVTFHIGSLKLYKPVGVKTESGDSPVHGTDTSVYDWDFSKCMVSSGPLEFKLSVVSGSTAGLDMSGAVLYLAGYHANNYNDPITE